MLAFTCPRCKARPGAWCWTRYGTWTTHLHAERFHLATDAGDLPLTDAEASS